MAAIIPSSLLRRRAENLVLFLIVNAFFLVFFEMFSVNRNNYSTSTYFRTLPPSTPGFLIDNVTWIRTTWQRLIDLDDFRYVIDSNVCECQQSQCTPILVHSHAGHFDQRQNIRQSYSRAVLDQFGLRYVFLAGLPDNADVQARLLQESSRYGDVVQGNFREAYRNLTYKHVMGLMWFAERCRQSVHAVKMDDDVAMNVYALGHTLARNDELSGCVIPRAEPVRDPRNKWYVTRAEYAGDTYPPFLSGWLYVARATTVRRLLRAMRHGEPYFWIDDVYVTGTLANRARIQLSDLRPDFETDPGPAYCCIRDQQRCGFLAAPVGDNLDLLRLYPEQLIRCRATNVSCDTFRKSKFHHPCLDLWKKSQAIAPRTGKPFIELISN